MNYDEFQTKRSELYHAKSEIAEKWDPDQIMNSYLNSAVSLMDGRVLNRDRNEFLSSYKLLGTKRHRTWTFNAMVILFYVLCLNLITWTKLKYFFKE